MAREEILGESGMSNQKPTAFNYNDYLKAMEENAAMQARLARVTAERNAAIKDCSGRCETCAFVYDCAKHDNNDAGPAVWHCDCEDWQWHGMRKEKP